MSVRERTYAVTMRLFQTCRKESPTPIALIVYLLRRAQVVFEGATAATVMATDTAFVIGCLALLGSRVPPTRYGSAWPNCEMEIHGRCPN